MSSKFPSKNNKIDNIASVVAENTKHAHAQGVWRKLAVRW